MTPTINVRASTRATLSTLRPATAPCTFFGTSVPSITPGNQSLPTHQVDTHCRDAWPGASVTGQACAHHTACTPVSQLVKLLPVLLLVEVTVAVEEVGVKVVPLLDGVRVYVVPPELAGSLLKP
jgi:hypothetical protein